MKYENYSNYLKFIEDYSKASNAATGSKFDANANVESKNVATLSTEMHKEANIGINRLEMYNRITELYGEDLAKEYIRQLESHELYRHDETHPRLAYCCAISMYPFLLDGLKTIGGPSSAPKNLNSFCGNFVNLVFAISSQFAGAVATPEFLSYMDYFIRKEYGDDYYLDTSKVVINSTTRPRTLQQYIEDCFEQVVYSINEPAAARNFQSVFWNISYFDKGYFNSLFEDFVFPDGTLAQWESISWLQKCFMRWFNRERARNYLTFPVETVNLLYDEKTKQYKDEEWASFTAEMWANGHSFFCYNSDQASALSSCCRLRNEITENVFSYTLGAGGISTGSKAVITINVNRLVQDCKKNNEDLDTKIREQVRKIHKYLLAYNSILEDELKDGLMPVYDAGYISLKKQYLTIGINGLVEGAEFLGIDISDNEDYFKYCESILRPIYEENKLGRNTCGWMFNTEYVPKKCGHAAA